MRIPGRRPVVFKCGPTHAIGLVAVVADEDRPEGGGPDPNAKPKSCASSSFQAAPMPRMARPPLIWSSVVAVLATSVGSRYNSDGPHRRSLLSSRPQYRSRLGSGPDTCWGRTNCFSYRADVSPFVPGNGAYVLTGFATGGNVRPVGASLVMVYQLAGLPTKTIMFDDDDISVPSGAVSGTAAFSDFSGTSPIFRDNDIHCWRRSAVAGSPRRLPASLVVSERCRSQGCSHPKTGRCGTLRPSMSRR